MLYRVSIDDARRYLDHGATSFPKPAGVAEAMVQFLDGAGGPYGRSAHARAQRTSRIVFETRELLAQLLSVTDSSRIAFTSGATMGLNLALCSLVRPFGRVLVCPLAHNAVMRPLVRLCQKTDLEYELLPHGPDGRIDVEAVQPGPNTCLAVVAAQSNVNGVLQPLAQLKQRLGAIPLVVDAAQSSHELGLARPELGLDVVVLTGHKGLLGPTGTGAIYVRPGLELEPLLLGGTGSRSDSFEPPTQMPDRLEAGTPNTVGIAGLGAALRFCRDNNPVGMERELARAALTKLRHLPGVELLAAANPQHQGGTFSFNIEGLSPSSTARLLETRFGFAVRAGLHCAPLAHATLGTAARGGAVRVAFGRFHDEPVVESLVTAIESLLAERE